MKIDALKKGAIGRERVWEWQSDFEISEKAKAASIDSDIPGRGRRRKKLAGVDCCCSRVGLVYYGVWQRE